MVNAGKDLGVICEKLPLAHENCSIFKFEAGEEKFIGRGWRAWV